MISVKNGPKKNHKRGIAVAALEKRRKEAQERQTKHNTLTLAQKLEHAGAKERAKLLAKKER